MRRIARETGGMHVQEYLAVNMFSSFAQYLLLNNSYGCRDLSGGPNSLEPSQYVEGHHICANMLENDFHQKKKG